MASIFEICNELELLASEIEKGVPQTAVLKPMPTESSLRYCCKRRWRFKTFA